jgi:hypothetical protein
MLSVGHCEQSRSIVQAWDDLDSITMLISAIALVRDT